MRFLLLLMLLRSTLTLRPSTRLFSSHHTLPRLYTPSTTFIPNSTLIFTPQQSHHLSTVLRLKVSNKVRCFNGIQGEYLIELNNLGKRESDGMVIKKLREQTKNEDVELIICSIKKKRLKTLIEKATELGVTSLSVINKSDYTSSAVDSKLLDKLKIVVEESSIQSERLTIPKVEVLEDSLEGFLEGVEDKIHVASERSETSIPLLKALKKDEHIKFLIGPEGGFSDAEKDMFRNNENCVEVGLGGNVLRAETAGIYCLSVWNGFRNGL